MNRRQKTVQRQLLQNEKLYIKDLKHQYAVSVAEVDKVIQGLLAREQTQSVVYQLQFQLQLREQLTRIYGDMQTKNYDTMMQYLNGCYKESFIGTIYDLQGQGIPLAFPLNQNQMTKAVVTDSKVSGGLYRRLGINVNDLKESIRVEITRGIASEKSYEQIARAIQRRSDVDYNKSLRIARTEGHRIQTTASLDVMHEAIQKGANIKKQWDATLDGVTRDTHRELDGQIVDVDEDFVVPSTGDRASAPSMFGDPAEDCNCRCCVLQRASWVLDADETRTKMDNDSKTYVSFKESGYEAFKNAYFENYD